jgi:hypothetical protein
MGSIHNLGDPSAIGPSDPNSVKRKAEGIQPAEDQVQLATIPFPAQVDQLSRTDPSSLKNVLSDSVQQLRVAASQSSDPGEAAYLSGLADRFQRLEEEANSATSPSPQS